jgi:hypothetical protein
MFRANLADNIMCRKPGLLLLLAGCVCCLFLTGCTAESHAETITPSNRDLMSSGVLFWQEQNPGLYLVCWAENDLNADSFMDTVIIYRLEDDRCRMVIAVNNSGEYHFSETVAAPLTDQKISFVDFDSRPPAEVVVTGRNGSFVGTAIFRLEQEHLVNIFDDDFDKCCRVRQIGVGGL